MVFSGRFCYMKVFWNTRLPSPKIEKATLCNARRDEDFDISHVCSVQRHLYRLEGQEEEARLNFIASVKPETAAAILGTAEDGISVIFHNNAGKKMTDNIMAEKGGEKREHE
jgi:hypothetical protein